METETVVRDVGNVSQPCDTEPHASTAVSVEEDRARKLVRGIMLVLDHHGAPEGVCNSFRAQAMSYLTVESEDIFFKRAKFMTVAPMAKYLKCVAPKAPEEVPSWMSSGKENNKKNVLKKWLHSRMNFSAKNTHFWYSYLQSKRSAAPASDELVLTTYEEHRAAMSREDPCDDETFNVVLKELGPVLTKIAKTVKFQYDADDWIATSDLESNYWGTEHGASNRACFEKARSGGGQMGHLHTVAPSVVKCSPRRQPSEGRTLPEFAGMTFYPFAMISGQVRTNVTFEHYEYPDGYAQWTESISKEAIRYVGGITLKCTIQAVLEPLKVRVISKGEAIPYYVSKPLQVALHDAMREMNCFRLIGRPLCPTDLLDLAQNRTILGSGRYEWFSIDYSAATDKLSARISAAILDRLTRGFSEDMREIWRAVLAPHWCRYPAPFCETVEPVQQQNGQLMGSILSFPILCLANLGLYLANISKDTRTLRDKLNGVLVNGDDMLYVAKESLWDSHVALGERVGLTMSPGKAYHHHVYANVNSACFHLRLDRGYFVDIPRSIPFLNSGLYFGQNKVLGGDDIVLDKSFSSTIQPLLDGVRHGQCARWRNQGKKVLSAFINRHSARIFAEVGNRNLFVSTGLGGMGIVPPRGFKYEVTLYQKLQAYRRMSEPFTFVGFGPLPGRPVPEPKAYVRVPWALADPKIQDPKYMKRYCGSDAANLPEDLFTRKNLLHIVRTCAFSNGIFGTSGGHYSIDHQAEYNKGCLAEALIPCIIEEQEYEDETEENLLWLRGITG